MPLNRFQKHILKDIRASENQAYGIKFIFLTTGAGYFSPFDAYRKQNYVEVTTLFSGSVLFNPASQKKDGAGGFFNTSDITIVASGDNRTIAQSKDVMIEYEETRFRINEVSDCEDSNEIVITASRLE